MSGQFHHSSMNCLLYITPWPRVCRSQWVALTLMACFSLARAISLRTYLAHLKKPRVQALGHSTNTTDRELSPEVGVLGGVLFFTYLHPCGPGLLPDLALNHHFDQILEVSFIFTFK